MMGDNHMLKVLGMGSFELTFTSGKKVVLKDVLHAPSVTPANSGQTNMT